MRNLILVLTIAFCFINCQTTNSHVSIIGVKIYDYKGDIKDLIREWKSIGINTAFVSKELLSNPDYQIEAQNAGIKNLVILPIFFDEHLDDHPEFYAIKSDGDKAIDEWVKLACPSNQEYRSKKINSILELVEAHNPDGISIDFIRHFVYWEKVYPDTPASELPNTCFCDLCINHFCQTNELSFPDFLSGTSEIAEWIQNSYSTQWINWKCQLITTMIDDIVNEVKKIKPDVLVNIHIVPWKNDAFDGALKRVAGQDIEAIAHLTNYLSPMTYAHMVKQKAPWVHEVVLDFHNQSKAKVLPSIQVKEAYLSDSISSQEFEENLKSALSPPSSGVIFWSWEHLEQDPWKKEIIKKVLN